MAHRSLSTARWIVDPVIGVGTNTTITDALANAQSGDTIFIRPGTYTEDLTLKAGVSLVSFTTFTDVVIVGKCTLTGSTGISIVSMCGITFQTNGDFALVLAGSGHATINLVNCYINCADNTAISYTNSNGNSAFQISYCAGNIATTGIALFSCSGIGNIVILASNFQNTGGSTTPSTCSGGLLLIQYCQFENAIDLSGNCSFNSYLNNYGYPDFNSLILTCGSAGQNFSFQDSFYSGTASAITISTTLGLYNCIINSSNANAITGTGTINYSLLSFAGSSSVINSTLTKTNSGTIQGSRNTAPSAGFLGERIESVIGSGSVALTSNTPQTVTSISLTPGIWDVSSLCVISGTLQTRNESGISAVNNTLGTGGIGIDTSDTPTSATALASVTNSVPSLRVTLSTTTTYYLVANSVFTGSASAGGRISATRVG